MMRVNGLDKHGHPLTLKGGVAEILEKVGKGKMLLAYSGGLHHVLPPGSKVVRPFKKLKLRLEVLDIGEYLEERRQNSIYQKKVTRVLIARKRAAERKPIN